LETITDLGIINRVNQDTYRIARNTSGAEIAAGKVVNYTGKTGNKPEFALANASSIDSMPAIGITTATVANNGYGQIMIIGKLKGLKTDYDGWVEGDVLFVDTVDGGLTNVRPPYPSFPQQIGTIEVVHENNGIILVNTQGMGGIEDGTNQTSFTVPGLIVGEDSLATPRAKIDTSWIDIDFNDKDITGVNKITADSGNIAEMWVMEERVDTISSGVLYGYRFYGIAVGQSYAYITDGSGYFWLRLDAANQAFYFPTHILNGDSIFLDSIKWDLDLKATDADTFLLGSWEEDASKIANATYTDTLVWDADSIFEMTISLGQGFKRNYINLFPIITALNVSTRLLIKGATCYYESWNKRYGQP